MGDLTVLGGGSLGLLLAGRLVASGCNCTLWTRTEQQAAQLNREGLIIQELSDQLSEPVHLHTIPIAEVSDQGSEIVLLTVKQAALTPEFLLWLDKVIPPEGTLVLFQNGIGHVQKLKEALPGRRLITALITEGANRIDGATVRHTGHGEIKLDASDCDHSVQLRSLEQMLVQAGFTVLLSNEMEIAVYQKLLINAVINPLTAILRIHNGQLTETPERIQLMQVLFNESFRILSLYGLTDQTRLWEKILQVCELTSRNESSMLQDIKLHKGTEIEFINGAICRMAHRHGMEAPWNEAVVALVKAAH